jgi:hypothetical protein
MRRLLSRRLNAFVGGMLGAMVLIFALLMAFTRTERGRERILAITLETLGGQFNGSLEAQQRLEGGLFTGARLYEIVLRDPDGQPLVSADSAYIDYRLATFFGGDVVITRLVLYHPDVLIYRLPGDSLWNYQVVLQDSTPEEPGSRGRATIVESMEVYDGVVTVRMPWEPGDRVPAAERERVIAAALSDTSRLAVESVPGGYLRTIVIRTPAAAMARLIIAPDERGGTYLEIASANGVIDLYRDEPLRFSGVTGELSLREGLMKYNAPSLVLPASRMSSLGVVDLRGDEPAYDLRVAGEQVALQDLRWLYPALPEEGVTSFDLLVESRPDGILLRASDLMFDTPGTRLVGQFGALLGDSILFSDVSLRADPLDVATVQRMLPVEIPVRGLQIGSIEIHSPAS